MKKLLFKKRNWRKRLALLLLGTLMIFNFNSSLSLALDEEELDLYIESYIDYLKGEPSALTCQITLTPLFDAETAKFLLFIDEHFKNEASNSTLMNTAIARYRGYKYKLREYYKMIRPSVSTEAGDGLAEAYLGQNLTEASKYQECNDLMDQYLERAKAQMIEHIQKTGTQKEATVLVKKYQAVNDKMRDLNLDMAEMMGYFDTFNNKLPAFTEQCLEL